MNPWPMVPLGEIAEVVTGSTPPKKEPNNYGAEVPWVRPGDLNGLVPVRHTAVSLSRKGAKKARLVPAGSLLVCCIGSVGRLGIAGDWLATNQQINSATFDERVLPEFAFFAMETQVETLRRRAATSVVSIINKNDFCKLLFPLPPLDEQRRIVDVLNRANGIRRLRREALDKTRQLIPALFVDMFGDPASAASFVPMRDLIGEYRYGTSQKSGPAGRPVLRIPNIVRGELDLNDLKTVAVSTHDYQRLRLQNGDLLFVRTNGNPNYVGRCSVFSSEAVQGCSYAPEEFIYASYLIRGRPDFSKIDPIFLQVYLSTAAGRRFLRERCRTSAGQYNINIEGLGGVPIPVHGVTEQHVFAERVADIQATIAQQERMAEASEQLVAALMAQLFDSAPANPAAVAGLA